MYLIKILHKILELLELNEIKVHQLSLTNWVSTSVNSLKMFFIFHALHLTLRTTQTNWWHFHRFFCRSLLSRPDMLPTIVLNVAYPILTPPGVQFWQSLSHHKWSISPYKSPYWYCQSNMPHVPRKTDYIYPEECLNISHLINRKI